jgi:hypothetical protein
MNFTEVKDFRLLKFILSKNPAGFWQESAGFS